jgi:carbon storage regulator
MLVVTRRRHESILIRGDIRIEVISTRGRQVRLGVAAPADVAVDRSEVRELKQGRAQAHDGAFPPGADGAAGGSPGRR